MGIESNEAGKVASAGLEVPFQIDKMVANLILSSEDQSVRRIIAFTAVDAGTNVAGLAAWTAHSFMSQTGNETCLVLTDTRLAPTLRKGEKPPLGQSRSTSSDAGVSQGSRTSVEVHNLQAPGPVTLTEHVSPAQINERLQELCRRFDSKRHVIVSGPPANTSDFQLGIAPLVDSVILVVPAGRLRKRAVLSLVNQLRKNHVPLTGAVLTERLYPIPEFIYRLL